MPCCPWSPVVAISSSDSRGTINLVSQAQTVFDLSRPRHVHVVGVSGPGMSAVALCLADMGHVVSGSDVRTSPVVDTLRARGVAVEIGHDASHVDGVEAVTYSTAVPADNVEIAAAREAGVEVMHRSGMLAAICARTRAIGIAGTHGKTTTSAMLLAVMNAAKINPSYVIGAEVLDTGTGAQWRESSYMIVEADESDGTHDALPLFGTIITNIDLDHLDHFGSLDGLRASFMTYASRVPGPAVLCGDHRETRDMANALRTSKVSSGAKRQVITYGCDANCDARISDVHETTTGSQFLVRIGSKSATVFVPAFGRHNVLNATAAIAMASALGVSLDVAASALANFGGVERRFQVRGEKNGSVLIDDYAHLPAEIEAAISATRQRFPDKRIIAVFQPNRFHRIQAMAGEYAHCFSRADHVVITDVYASGTPRIEGVTGRLVVDAVVGEGGHESVAWCETRTELVDHVASLLSTDTVCVSMGCGDIDQFPAQVIAKQVMAKDTPAS